MFSASEIRCPVRLRIPRRDDAAAEEEETTLDALISRSRGLSSAEFAAPLRLVVVDERGAEVEFRFRPNRRFLQPSRKSSLYLKTFKSAATPANCHLDDTLDGGASALSACDATSFAGVLRIAKDVYILGASPDGKFYVEPQNWASCEFSIRRKRRATNGEHTHHKAAFEIPDYYAKYRQDRIAYVELMMTADHSIFEKYHRNETTVSTRLHSVANIVNSLYTPLNIQVVLVSVDIWKEGDAFDVSSSGERTLDNYMQYRRKRLGELPNDCAHMLTDIRFEAGVVGKAFKGTLCGLDYSGGVDVDHQANAASVASTVAHELGHNFGLEHDATDYDATCQCYRPPCIMSPATGYVPPTYFSECSLVALDNAFRRKIATCLANLPEETHGGARCGNGLVEAGEECDCGAEEFCSSTCCDAKTCKLREGAKCASGACCDQATCQPRKRATMCRAAAADCDLPEYCDGESAQCPGDFYVQDGYPCPGTEKSAKEGLYGARAVCFHGVCSSRRQQCEAFWGNGVVESPLECYVQNTLGIMQGNCGYDPLNRTYEACEKENEQCGRVMCDTKLTKPIWGDPHTVSSAYSFIRTSTEDRICRILQADHDDATHQADPGLVRDGAPCGKDKICLGKKCVPRTNVTRTLAVCPMDCRGVGLCNNVGNCHCEVGYGGLACDIPGYGGSINSNPAATNRGIYNPFLLATLILLIGLGIFIWRCVVYWKAEKKFLPRVLWRDFKRRHGLYGERVPMRKAPAPPNAPRNGGARGQDTSSGRPQSRLAAASPRALVNSFHNFWSPQHQPNQHVAPPPPPPPPPKVPFQQQPLTVVSYSKQGHHNCGSPQTSVPLMSATSPTDEASPQNPLPPPQQVLILRGGPAVPERPRAAKLNELYKEHGHELSVPGTSRTEDGYSLPPPDDPIPSKKKAMPLPPDVDAPPVPQHKKPLPSTDSASSSDQQNAGVRALAMRFETRC